MLGFEDFLAHVESDRFNRMIKTPQMFEKFLPFAMALGVEKNWSKAFQNIYTQPPSWYQGGYGPNFYPYMFVNNLNTMSSQAAAPDLAEAVVEVGFRVEDLAAEAVGVYRCPGRRAFAAQCRTESRRPAK